MKIETRSIEWVPREERHGKPSDLFSIWFGGNMHITTLVTGALCVVSGLNLFWSVVAILLGNLIGAVFMALHSAQGPILGIPQMIQSRAQFGIIGAIVPLIIVIFMYLGFFSTSSLLAAQTINGAFSIPITASILIINLVVFIVTLYGHDLIQRMQKVLSWVFLAVYIFVTFVVFNTAVPAGSWNPGNFNLAVFLLAVSITATWQIAYAPYVADYSRYLPEDTSEKATFWYTYAGSVCASVWMMILGSFLVAANSKFLDASGPNLAKLFGAFAIGIYIIIILGQISINSFNLYGAFMSTTTTVEPFLKMKVTPAVRGVFIACIVAIASVIEILGQGSFISLFKSFILFICYFLIPWTAINLIDFYLLRDGKYSVKDMFDLDGKYGRVNWITMVAYVIAVLVEIPFVNTTFYVGPLCNALGGADISWVLGLVIPCFLYYFPMKKKLRETGL
ncbi:cytosine permease [Clostridium sp. AWRP]|uniref:purine-cytosine permease family protein n=1 Tax=Clostridium sp. AWRP TaxID=2212991 RepID=UPI000FDA20F9|nr:cytosine permease [Clostridium sp. AWRP]AZV57088.1 cytosine permease [Clostridium sp. AWRP]